MVRDVSGESDAVPLFGGSGANEVGFSCQKTGQPFVQAIPNQPGVEIVGPADPSSASTVSPASSKAVDDGFVDWAKASRQTATDYCETMLTTSTTAIPVYYAILKYIGIDKIGTSFVALVGVIPPLLFLTAVILFVLALRPRFATLTVTEFATFRAERLRRLDQYITIGTIAFVIGVGLAIALFIIALYLI